MKLLILTQYFPPEVGAPQNRLYGLARHLAKMGVEVSVLTAMPNYPQMKVHAAYAGKRYVLEKKEDITIHRSSIYVSNDRSVISRLRNYFSFVISSALTGNKRLDKFDFLLCESPPLFLGYSAMYLARKKSARLIFNVSDLWPESAEKLGVVSNKLLLGLAYRLEARLYRRSALVTGQTQGICADIKKRFPSVDTYWLPNGADLDEFDSDSASRGTWRQDHGLTEDELIFLYAGIIGLAQGLEVILECAGMMRSRGDIRFVFLGDGPERAKLKEIAERENLKNVLFLNPVTKKEMPVVLANADAAIIPLKDLPIFRGAIPSKIFECLAMKVPVLLGVRGEAYELFVKDGRCALFFAPGDAAELAAAVDRLAADKVLRQEIAINGFNYVKKNFDQATIARAFFRRLSQLSNAGRK